MDGVEQLHERGLFCIKKKKKNISLHICDPWRFTARFTDLTNLRTTKGPSSNMQPESATCHTNTTLSWSIVLLMTGLLYSDACSRCSPQFFAIPWFSARGLVTEPLLPQLSARGLGTKSLLPHDSQPEDWWKNHYYSTIISQRTGDRTFTTPQLSARGLMTEPLLPHNYQPEDWWQNLYYPTIISQRTDDRTFTTPQLSAEDWWQNLYYPTIISQRTGNRTFLLPHNYQPEDW